MMVKGYFEQGGQFLWVGRVVGSYTSYLDDPVTNDFAQANLNSIGEGDGPSGVALRVYGSSVGTWGDGTFISTRKYETILGADISTAYQAIAANGTNAIPLDSMTGVEIGDIIRLEEGANISVSVVVDIDIARTHLDLIHSRDRM